MSDIVGTIITVENFLSKTDISLNVKSENSQENVISLKSNREYRIPLFQREIRWDTNNVNILLSDLLTSPRFLGNIILSINPDNSVCEIIDGQQRTTILIMILRCIYKKHGTTIDLFDVCPINNESFPGFQKVIDAGFDMSEEDYLEIEATDAYKQMPHVQRLWNCIYSSEIINNRRHVRTLLENVRSSQLNIIASHSSRENTSIRYFLDVNLKGVQLDTEDIFKGYLFSQDSSSEIRSLWQEIKQLCFKINSSRNRANDNIYPMMKVYEHFFYCDLYTARPNGQDYSGIKFGSDFCLTNSVTLEEGSFYEGTHIIDVIYNKDYLNRSLKIIKRSLNLIYDIISSEAPGDMFKDAFRSSGKIDHDIKKSCYIIIKKILLEKEIIPKVLVIKFIISFFDGKEHTKNEYKYIYSIYAAANIFTVFAPKKESETFYSIVSSDNWQDALNKWLAEYSVSSKLTRGKLYTAFKYSAPNENEELIMSYRCKALAAMYNYINVTSGNNNVNISVNNCSLFNTYFSDSNSFSVEHFIVGENGTLKIKTDKFSFQYNYPPQIKKYRNSLFNYIFIPKTLNSDLGNTLLRNKLSKATEAMEQIKCPYSRLYLETLSEHDKYFREYPTSQILGEFDTK